MSERASRLLSCCKYTLDMLRMSTTIVLHRFALANDLKDFDDYVYLTHVGHWHFFFFKKNPTLPHSHGVTHSLDIHEPPEGGLTAHTHKGTSKIQRIPSLASRLQPAGGSAALSVRVLGLPSPERSGMVGGILGEPSFASPVHHAGCLSHLAWRSKHVFAGV